MNDKEYSIKKTVYMKKITFEGENSVSLLRNPEQLTLSY